MSLRESLINVTLMLSIASASFAADVWHVPYGKEKGKVVCFNSKTDKDFAEDQPYGPLSFRLSKDKLWVLDSIGGRLYSFDEKNKLASCLEIRGLPQNLLLEDFALNKGRHGTPESVWIAEAAECNVRKISLGSGKELLRIGGNGSENGQFKQINQLEVDRTGRLYVGDLGRSVISVFTPYGELVREIPWQGCGFALDKNSRLHTLHYSDSAGYFINVFTVKGQLIKNLHIGFPELTNPRVWAVSPEGNLIVSFIPAGGFKGTLKLLEISPFGKIVRRLEFKPPTSMNRYLAGSESTVWIADADYFTAPDGEFSVKSVKWGEAK